MSRTLTTEKDTRCLVTMSALNVYSVLSSYSVIFRKLLI